MGQAKSLSAASLEEDLKEINQQTKAKEPQRPFWKKQLSQSSFQLAETLLHMGKKVMGLMCAPIFFLLVSHQTEAKFFIQRAPGGHQALQGWGHPVDR